MEKQKMYEIILDKEKYYCTGVFIARCEKTGQIMIFSGNTSAHNLFAIAPATALVRQI